MIKAKIVKYAKLLYENGLNLSMSGNISILSDNLIYITPRGMFKAQLRPEDISIIDREGNIINNIPPSSEFRMHIEIYNARDDISSIVHAHCFYSSLIGVLPLDLSEFALFAEAIINIGIPARIDYYLPSSVELADAAAAAVKKSDVLIMANNGLTAVGDDIVKAFSRVESAEHLAKAVYMLRNEPEVKKLGKQDIDALLDICRKDG